LTGPEPVIPATQLSPDNLTARVFRALYQDLDLHTVTGIHIAVPKGTPYFAAPSLGEIAWQISDRKHDALAEPSPSPRLRAADALAGRRSSAARSEKPMYLPDPFPPPPPGARPTRAAADLIHALTSHGITSIYTAAAAKLAVISVTADLTVWTNGHQFWCSHRGQRLTWPAADIETAAARIAALTRPTADS